MKHKVNELDGALLDQAVAKAAGMRYDANIDRSLVVSLDPPREGIGSPLAFYSACMAVVDNRIRAFAPSSDWRDGGPIIERELMRSSEYEAELYPGQRWHYWTPSNVTGHGPTPLIAAMRAYVASKLGEEVELP